MLYNADWNSEFQILHDQTEDIDECERWKELSKLAQDFVDTSKKYGKIIISELTLPDDVKTIKPCDIGGKAGGKKYKVAGIFFKFAQDLPVNEEKEEEENNTCGYGSSLSDAEEETSENAYSFARNDTEDNGPEKPIRYVYGKNRPKHEGAIKAASNEMLGLLGYYNSGVEGLHYPLLCIIDYKGERLLAMSRLPIASDETLQYGSRDAGGHVINCNEQLSEKMKKVGERLNIAGHSLLGAKKITNENGEEENQEVVKLYAPIDIEGHYGDDNRFYVLDFGRTFPPEYREIKNSKLFYYLLRPEFVRKYHVPLSSDALTFGKIDAKIHDKNVEEATKYLHNEIIPNFAEKLINNETIGGSLTEKIHREGINCRHLGEIYSKLLKAPKIRVQVLSEIVARSLKSIFRSLQSKTTEEQKLIKKYKASEEPYENIAFKILKSLLSSPKININNNLKVKELQKKFFREKLSFRKLNKDAFYSKSSQSKYFWNIKIKVIIQRYFVGTFKKEELIDGKDLRNLINIDTVVYRFCELSGIGISDDVMKDYHKDPDHFTLMKFYVIRLKAKIRHLNVIDEAKANLLFRSVKKLVNPTTSIWQTIHNKFQSAILSNPNIATYIQWGKAFFYHSFSFFPQCDIDLNSIADLIGLNTNNNNKNAMFSLSLSNSSTNSNGMNNNQFWDTKQPLQLLQKVKEKLEIAKEFTSNEYQEFKIQYWNSILQIEISVIKFYKSEVNPKTQNIDSQWKFDQGKKSIEQILNQFHGQINDLKSKITKKIEILGNLMNYFASKSKYYHQQCLFLLRAIFLYITLIQIDPKPQYHLKTFNLLFEYLKKNPDCRHIYGIAGNIIDNYLQIEPNIYDKESKNIIHIFQAFRWIPYLSIQQYNHVHINIYKAASNAPENKFIKFDKSFKTCENENYLYFVPYLQEKLSHDDNGSIGRFINVLRRSSESNSSRNSFKSGEIFYLKNIIGTKFLLTALEIGIAINKHPIKMEIVSYTLDKDGNNIEKYKKIILLSLEKEIDFVRIDNHKIPGRFLFFFFHLTL